MAVKVKELKEDMLVDIKVNKHYYFMLKEALHFLFNLVPDPQKRAELFMKITDVKYEDMQPVQRAFYTVTLIVAEIERTAKEQNLFDEKEVLEPGDEGYVEPSIEE
jgi:hypothetical protein